MSDACSGSKRKRAKTEDDAADATLVNESAEVRTLLSPQEAEAEVPPTRSDIWFPDGNIVLQVEDTQFRVHGGLLSRHSRVLKEMIDKPRNLEEQGLGDVVDGCPIISLGPEDSWEDWEELLALIYDGPRKAKSNEPCTLSLVAAMLRLGQKYGFDHYRAEGLMRLNATFPSKLVNFNSTSCPPSRWLVVDENSSFCDLLNLVYELDLGTCLPSLHYYGVVHNNFPAYLFSGTKDAYGITTTVSPEIQAKFILGRDHLCDAMAKHTFRWLFDDTLIPDPKCDTKPACKRHCTQVIAEIWAPRPNLAYALAQWSRAKFAGGLCKTCTHSAALHFAKGRYDLWEALPAIFNFKDWHELTDEVAEDEAAPDAIECD